MCVVRSLLECAWYVIYLGVRGTEFTSVCVVRNLFECAWYGVYLSVRGT